MLEWLVLTPVLLLIVFTGGVPLEATEVFDWLSEKWIMMKPKKWRTDQDGVFDFNNQYSCASVRGTTCCGTCELYWLDDGPLAALAVLAGWQTGRVKGYDDMGNISYDGNFKPVVLFTDRTTFRNGTSLADYITRHRLGEVVTTTPVRNPNSGANVQGWLWRIDRRRWERWVRDHVIFEDKTRPKISVHQGE